MDARWQHIAARQHGLVTRRQLRSLLAGYDAVEHLIGSGRLEAVTDEVLRLRGSPSGRGQKVMAAVLDSGSGAVLASTSACSWWGVSGAPLEPLHVARTSRSSRRPDGVVLHTVRSLPERWGTELDGVPIARPELVALQLFGTVHRLRAERWVDGLWARRLLDGRSIERLLASMGRRGRNGTAGLREYLEERGPGYVPPASGIESRAVQVLGDAGIAMDRQVDSGGDQWTGRVDLRHRWLPVLVEVQSALHHSALVDQRADEARLARLRSEGFEVVEVTDTEVWARPDVVVRRVRAAMAAARDRLRAS